MSDVQAVSPRLVASAAELEILTQILDRRVPNVEVWAFGSRIHGTTKKYADLDLMLIAEHPLPLIVVGSLADDFTESDLPYKVDLVDWSTTLDPFRSKIEADHVVIHHPMKNLSDLKRKDPD